MRKLTLIFICLFALSAPALARQNAAQFQLSACPFAIPSGTAIDCGMLTVPENHNTPDGKQIQLAVARIYSSSGTPQADPLIYLAGGPGEGALSSADAWVNSPIRQKRDIILLDQRGTGYSQPALNCPPMTTFDDVEACRAQWVSAGVNLSDYNSAQSAADIADLRVALGYREWNLFGVSYGTRLALTAMRDHADGIRSVILDSVYPPQVNDWEEFASDEANAFSTLFKACAADAVCNEAYPDLENAFYRTVAQLNDQPILYNPTTGGNAVALDGNTLAETLYQALYLTANIPYLPKVIYGVSQGDYPLLSQLETGEIFYKSPLRQGAGAERGAAGMYNSVTCSEEIPFTNEDKALADAQAARPELRDRLTAAVQSVFATCAIWSVTPVSRIEALPVTSDLPALVLAGAFDPATPVAWGRSAAKTLSKSFFFEFPSVAHGVIDSGECASRIILAFLDNPTLPPASGCLNSLRELQFVTH
ncbi:MAG: alpha/beta fold hydrolase [Chloroflexota bacterium]